MIPTRPLLLAFLLLCCRREHEVAVEAFSLLFSSHHRPFTANGRTLSSSSSTLLNVAKIDEWRRASQKKSRVDSSSSSSKYDNEPSSPSPVQTLQRRHPVTFQPRKLVSSNSDINAAGTTAISDVSADRKGATIPTLSVSLIKSIVGGGVLALPSGFAAMGGSDDIVPAAIATILACGTLNAFYFSLMGKVCDETKATSYKEAWERTMGADTSPLVAVVVTLKTGLACLAYSMILADSGQALAQAAGLTDVTRTEALLAITGTLLVPLTLRKDLSSLAPFSMIGLMGVLLTTSTVVTRYRDGTYLPETGTFAQDLPAHLQPSFVDHAAAASSLSTSSSAAAVDALATATSNTATDFGWPGVVLACTLATAFVAHYNAPRFYNELQESSVERFETVTFTSYGIAAIVFVIVGVCGFLTFGEASQGYILNNYSATDPLATLSKTALTCSILVTFPLPFVGLRDGLMDLLKVSDREQVHEATTLALLSVITVGALSVHDLALVLSVGGGTFSTAVSAVFPVLMFLAMESDKKTIGEQIAAATGMVLSVGIGLTGVNLALAKAAAAAAAVST